jgi:hypothetical protein
MVRGLTEIRRSGLSTHLLGDESFWAIVIPAIGAKVVAAGVGTTNALWTAPIIESRSWIAGGERTWLAPEGGPDGIFYGDDVNEWRVPPALDPGTYRVVEGDAAEIRTQSDMVLTSASGATLSIQLGRTISIEKRGSGGEITVTSAVTGTGDEPIEPRWAPWSICQLPADRPALIATETIGEKADPIEIFGNLRDGDAESHGSLFVMRSQAGRKIKVGFPVDRAAGRTVHVSRHRYGYVGVSQEEARRVDGGSYVDRPARGDSRPGDIVQLYNHNESGRSGFSEIELHAPSRAIAPGTTVTHTVRYRIAVCDDDIVSQLAEWGYDGEALCTTSIGRAVVTDASR